MTSSRIRLWQKLNRSWFESGLISQIRSKNEERIRYHLSEAQEKEMSEYLAEQVQQSTSQALLKSTMHTEAEMEVFVMLTPSSGSMIQNLQKAANLEESLLPYRPKFVDNWMKGIGPEGYSRYQHWDRVMLGIKDLGKLFWIEEVDDFIYGEAARIGREHEF